MQKLSERPAALAGRLKGQVEKHCRRIVEIWSERKRLGDILDSCLIRFENRAEAWGLEFPRANGFYVPSEYQSHTIWAKAGIAGALASLLGAIGLGILFFSLTLRISVGMGAVIGVVLVVIADYVVANGWLIAGNLNRESPSSVRPIKVVVWIAIIIIIAGLVVALTNRDAGTGTRQFLFWGSLAMTEIGLIASTIACRLLARIYSWSAEDREEYENLTTKMDALDAEEAQITTRAALELDRLRQIPDAELPQISCRMYELLISELQHLSKVVKENRSLPDFATEPDAVSGKVPILNLAQRLGSLVILFLVTVAVSGCDPIAAGSVTDDRSRLSASSIPSDLLPDCNSIHEIEILADHTQSESSAHREYAAELIGDALGGICVREMRVSNFGADGGGAYSPVPTVIKFPQRPIFQEPMFSEFESAIDRSCVSRTCYEEMIAKYSEARETALSAFRKDVTQYKSDLDKAISRMKSTITQHSDAEPPCTDQFEVMDRILKAGADVSIVITDGAHSCKRNKVTTSLENVKGRVLILMLPKRDEPIGEFAERQRWLQTTFPNVEVLPVVSTSVDDLVASVAKK